MRKASLTMALLLLFMGCRSVDLSAEVAEKYAATASLCANARIWFYFPDRVCEFRVSCKYRDDVTEIRVLEPSSVSDIVVRAEGKTCSLEYEGALLSIGEFEDISPMSAIPRLIRAWKSGACEQSRLSNGELELAWSEGETDYYTIFDEISLTPKSAEIFSHGARIINCTFEGFTS